MRDSLDRVIRSLAARAPLLLYLGSMACIVAAASAVLATSARAHGLEGALLVAAILLSVLATGQLAVTVVKWIAALLVRPHALPRMDFSAGVPAAARTLVVVPTMLTSEQAVEDLVEALEVRFLANRDAAVEAAKPGEGIAQRAGSFDPARALSRLAGSH